jgi:hypothetical protein
LLPHHYCDAVYEVQQGRDQLRWLTGGQGHQYKQQRNWFYIIHRFLFLLHATFQLLFTLFLFTDQHQLSNL